MAEEGEEVLVDVVDRKRDFYGASAELFQTRDEEVLCESGAGTGKSFAAMCYADWIARNYPGARIVFCRQTRQSMNETVLVDWEEQVLWPGHPAMGTATSRPTRQRYRYPNGSTVVLFGLDNVTRIMSGQYDIAIFFEATEGTLKDWEYLSTRLRNGKVPWAQLIADVNPTTDKHWLNQRAKDGKMRRLLFRHEDNPRWFDHEKNRWTEEGIKYMARLDRLTGARRKRLLLHQWVPEEGLFYPSYNARTHLIERGDLPKMRWHFGGMDFGFTKPGCIELFGVDSEDYVYRVAEVYKTAKTINWWAEILAELHAKYEIRAIACDSHRPDDIEVLNRRISSRGGDPICVKADKARATGFEMVRNALAPDGYGIPRVRFVKDAVLYGLETDEFGDKATVTGLEDEIESYTFATDTEGSEKDDPDDKCEDHALDALRYAMMWKFGKTDFDPATKPRFKPGSLGAILGHAELMERSRDRWLADFEGEGDEEYDLQPI